MDEMDLAQVRLARVTAHSRAVLDGRASMRVPRDAEAGEEAGALAIGLAEGVAWAGADGDDESRHARSDLSCWVGRPPPRVAREGKESVRARRDWAR